MAEKLKDKVAALIEKPLLDEGCELVELVHSRFKNNHTLRVFIYSRNGTTVDECARVSRIIGDIIDGSELFPNGYALEVSSPGLDRPLRTARDFAYRVGETVRIDFAESGRRRLTATIVSATADRVEFEKDSETFSLDLSEIEQAKIVF